MGGGSKQESQQQQTPGTFSPVTATLFSLFGPQAGVGGQGYVPTGFGTPGSAFTPESFGALPGLLQNRPANPIEQFLAGGGLQGSALGGALQGQDLLQQGANALPALLQTEPTAAIAAARRGFSQETLPAILERAPGFSSSDLQRELTRGGVDLETNIAALREANLGRVGQTVAGLPAYAQALGTNLLDMAAQNLGFGQVGREFLNEVSPAGDAFRVLAALQSLTGPALTSQSFGGSKGKSTQVL